MILFYNKNTNIENKYMDTKWKEDVKGNYGGINICTTDTLHKIGELMRNYCIDQGTLVNALW